MLADKETENVTAWIREDKIIQSPLEKQNYPIVVSLIAQSCILNFFYHLDDETSLYRAYIRLNLKILLSENTATNNFEFNFD